MSDSIGKGPTALELMLRVSDVLFLWQAGRLAYFLCFRQEISQSASLYNGVLFLECLFAFLLLHSLGVYGGWNSYRWAPAFARLAYSLGLLLSIGVMTSFVIHVNFELSIPWVIYWYILGLGLLIISRIATFEVVRFLQKKGLYCRPVVIIGYGKTGKKLHEMTLVYPWYGYEVKALYSDLKHPAPGHNPPDLQIIPTLAALGDYVATNPVAEIWLTLPFTDADHLSKLRSLLGNTLVDVRLIPDVDNVEILSSKIEHFFGLPTIDLNRPQIVGHYALFKDVFDRLFAAVALVALSPLLILIALAVKFSSPGPVIFRQRRIGLNGKVFDLYKFRSMRHDVVENVNQATANDPRITSIGRFLRRTSLDELPQFFNVLLGNMSIVGPRPHALQHNEIYMRKLERYMLRHRVKPGITGWAQINGYRGETDTDDKMAMRVQYDIHYIKNWSFWLDVKIIVLTGIKGWSGANAY